MRTNPRYKILKAASYGAALFLTAEIQRETMKKLTKIIITVLVLLTAACAMGVVVLSNASMSKTALKRAQNTAEGIVVTWEPMTLIHKYAVYRIVGNEEEWTHLSTV